MAHRDLHDPLHHVQQIEAPDRRGVAPHAHLPGPVQFIQILLRAQARVGNQVERAALDPRPVDGRDQGFCNVFDQHQRQFIFALAPNLANGIVPPHAHAPVKGTAAAANHHTRPQNHQWQSTLAAHLLQQFLGGCLGAGIEIAMLDSRIKRRRLGNGAGAAATVIGIDGPRVEKALDAGLERALGHLSRGLDFELLIIGPALHVGSRQMHHALDALHGVNERLPVKQIADATVHARAQFLGQTGRAAHQQAHAAIGRDQLPHQFLADKAGAAQHQNLRVCCGIRGRGRRNGHGRVHARKFSKLLAKANHARAEVTRDSHVCLAAIKSVHHGNG